MSLAIRNMRCEYRECPLGVDVASPRLTWVYEGELSGRAQIRVIAGKSEIPENDLLWDSGWFDSAATAVNYTGAPLASDQRVWWKAMTRIAGQAETQTEAVSWFETGLPEDSDWHGSWIRADSDWESPVMLRTFHLDAVPERARIYLCGLGIFELYVNGRPVGDEVLQPVQTAYSRQPGTNMLYPYCYEGAFRTPYRVFSLDGLLNKGKNEIEVRLGNGWYHQKGRLLEGDLWYGDSPVLLAELRMDDAILFTDERWQWHESQIVRNNLFFGEETDLRRGDFPLRPVKLAPAPDGKLRSQLCPSDAAMEGYDIARVLPARDGRLLADFAQNLSGWVEVTACARRGDRLELRFSEEIAPDGEQWQLDYDSAGGNEQIQMDAFTFAGTGEESVRPHFCWHGYRYAEITLLRDEAVIPLAFNGEALTAPGFRARLISRFVTANHSVSGHFACDNELLNWYHRATVFSLRSNEHCGVPLDCPHRERLGYTGDGQVTSEVILLNLDSAAFLTKWMRDILDSQNRRTGHVPHTAPFYNGGGGPGGWGSAVVFVPWTLYRFTGDDGLLREAWPHMLRWLEYLDSRSENGIVVREEDGGWCLGDWCVPGKLEIEPELVNSALVVRMLDEMIRIARILGENHEAERLTKARETRHTAFVSRFYHPQTAGFGVEKQGSEALALWCGVIPEGDRPRIMRKLLDDLAAREYHFDTGIFATPAMLEVLNNAGESDAACRLMLSEGFPSFDFMRRNGATTLHESWEGNASHNHAMFGAADAWLYAAVAGVSQAADSVGWQRVIFRPGRVCELSFAEAFVETPLGRCGIKWERCDGKLIVHTELPALSSAVMYLPDGTELPVVLGRSVHEISLRD